MPEEKETGTVIHLSVPLDHHPGTIRGESPGASLGRAALSTLYDGAAAINTTAERVQDKARLASAAQPYAERALASAGRALATMRAQVGHLDREIASALRPTVDPTLAGQIRSHWARQGAGALPGLRAAIDQGDLATIGAVLGAPAYLSGLSPESMALLRDIAARRLAPAQVSARAETADALSRVERATSHFASSTAEKIREWRSVDDKIIREGLK
jgi:hypothetical protein